jgi:hypothetical protein
MDSRAKIAWQEHQNLENYKEYYENNANLSQAVLYIAYGLKPMADKWHRIKRKSPIYNLNKSKEAKILSTKEHLFTALLQDKIQAYGYKGIGKALEYVDRENYFPAKQYLCSEHELESSIIPADFWDPLYTNFDKNFACIPQIISYTNITIQTEKLTAYFSYEHAAPELLENNKTYTNEEIEFILFAAKYFFDTPADSSYTKSSKKLASKLQEKYHQLTGRKMSDNKAKVTTSILKNEYINKNIIRKIRNS